MTATHEDAMLVVQLMRWSTEMGLEEALAAIFAESFDPEATGTHDPSVHKVLFFGETVGTLVKHGVLDRGLLRDLLWVDGIWARVGPRARAARTRDGVPALYENFEALVSGAGG